MPPLDQPRPWPRRRGSLFLALALLFSPLASGLQAEEPGYTEGQLLVASEAMRDGGFAQSVIYMVEHNENGAFGLIVNQPLGEVAVQALFDRAGVESEGLAGSVRAYRGGPVEAGLVSVLHSDDYDGPQTRGLANGLAMTSQLDILAEIAAGRGPARALFVLGYSGWGPGQLEGEMARGGWVVVPYDEALLFDLDDREKWSRAISALAIDL